MRQIKGRYGRLAHIGVDMPRQAAKPGFDRVDGLRHAGEVAALDRLLDEPELLVRDASILIPNRDCRGDVDLPDDIGTKLLECRIGIERLVARVGIDEHRGLVGHDLLEDRPNRLALGKPLLPDPGHNPRCVYLVQADRPRAPPIWKRKPVEVIENSGMSRCWKSE